METEGYKVTSPLPLSAFGAFPEKRRNVDFFISYETGKRVKIDEEICFKKNTAGRFAGY